MFAKIITWDLAIFIYKSWVAFKNSLFNGIYYNFHEDNGWSIIIILLTSRWRRQQRC